MESYDDVGVVGNAILASMGPSPEGHGEEEEE